jgi:hypothetical protein
MELEKIDKRFVGIWKGTDNGSYNVGEVNSWIVNRKEDGTFVIKFKTEYHNGSTELLEEKGQWWINGDLFYELKEKAKNYDCYVFSFINKDTIQFIDAQDDFEEPYSFLDKRMYLD